MIREILESIDYKVLHNSYTDAVKEAKAYAQKRGFEVDDEEWANVIGLGPRKHDSGETNRFDLKLYKNGKEQKKMLHIQIYNTGNKYELNVYIN